MIPSVDFVRKSENVAIDTSNELQEQAPDLVRLRIPQQLTGLSGHGQSDLNVVSTCAIGQQMF